MFNKKPRIKVIEYKRVYMLQFTYGIIKRKHTYELYNGTFSNNKDTLVNKLYESIGKRNIELINDNNYFYIVDYGWYVLKDSAYKALYRKLMRTWATL